ncbi:MotA/TolQ/ExbB proton channel family protein [bacterium]|nr:MotA/TolQ/ExbB proton channel family protein [bacterium]
MSLSALLHQGGVFMFPLLLGSILTVAICIERGFYFASLERGGVGFLQHLQDLLSKGDRAAAIEWLKGRNGPVPGTALAALQNWTAGRQTLEDAVVARSRVESPRLYRYLNVLETTVTASPLIGLLGTITGMMGVFRAVSAKMANTPNADTSHILAGIGEALVATATGILLAVVSLLAHNFFQALAESQLEASERVGDQLLLAHSQEAQVVSE